MLNFSKKYAHFLPFWMNFGCGMHGLHRVFVEYQLEYVLTVGGGDFLFWKYCGLIIEPIMSGTRCVTPPPPTSSYQI